MTIRFTPSRRPGQGRLATASGAPQSAAVLGEARPAGPVAARPVAFTLAPAATGSALAAFAPLLASGQSLYCVDGANSFSPYRLAEAARSAGCDPALLLERVFVSRAYTCHQLEAAAATVLEPLLGHPLDPETGSEPPLMASVAHRKTSRARNEPGAHPAIALPDLFDGVKN